MLRLRTTRLATVTVLAAVLAASVLVGQALARPNTAPTPVLGRVVDASFLSRALAGRIGYRVYLPPDYDSTSTRYPVIYFLHGLPAPSNAYQQLGYVAKALGTLRSEAILVVPQAARAGRAGDPEYQDWGPGANWETALSVELPSLVDSRYRTIATRSGRALIGLSAGGYGATIMALHHLARFGVIESWSGYFHPTDPSGEYGLDVGGAARNANASVHTFVSALKADFRRFPTFFAFYVGQGDDLFRDENEQLDRELRQAGVAHVFAEYPGGHATSLWAAHAPGWLAMALAHMAKAR